MSRARIEGRRSYERGYSRNPFTREPAKSEWQAGYDGAEAKEREAFAARQAEDAKWRYLPESYRAMDALERAVGEEQAEAIKALIAAMIAERHD